jgi:aspartate beta-hydroxylase
MLKATLRPQMSVAQTMAKARKLIGESQAVSAEVLLRSLVEREPTVFDAWLLLADLAEQRGEGDRARDCLLQAVGHAPQDMALALAVAQKQLVSGYPDAAIDTLASVFAREPHNVVAWVLLGDTLRAVGEEELALRARHQAVLRGQATGQLISNETTPPVLLPLIHGIIAEINEQERSRIVGALAQARAQLGAEALTRFEHAMAVYLGQLPEETPASAHQRPSFLYYPGLPEGPFHDPARNSWLAALSAGIQDIQAEAKAFLQGKQIDATSRQAVFLYRAGARNEGSRKHFPKTAALLEGTTLGTDPVQMAEVFISVLPAGWQGAPEQGSSNTRLTLQLPLQVPSAGAQLQVHGAAAHAWKEGEAVMFDATFMHQMENRADSPCVMLQIDCWNPDLSAAEQAALCHLFQTISDYKTFPVRDLHALAQQIRTDATDA